MNITTKKEEHLAVLKLEGRFDAYQVPAVKKALEALLDHYTVPRIIVDLADVSFIDSAGLATLVVGLKHARETSGRFCLCELQQATRIIFELSWLDKAFEIYATEEEARAALRTPLPIA